ncbi:MAG: hypothetical protein Q9168_003080 [Polycauliona sp. 1 TL-2023]
MGIPHFAAHLEPYSINATLGYKDPRSDPNAADPPKFVIDGPALAYHIYYRLAHRSHALGAFDALPSYHQIGQAAVAFLSELEAHHIHLLGLPSPYFNLQLTVIHSAHIYFDGYLPLHKRHVRLARLESCLRDLIKLQAKCPKGLGLANVHPEPSPPPLTSSQLFNSFHSIPPLLRGLPAPPFLVPAVLDALSSSTYASVTEIVSAEADTACAKAAKDEAGVILTSDSDMLVYEIGDTSAVVFFSGLERHEEPESTPVVSVLKAKLYPTAQIAKRLELPRLLHLAYQCKLHPTVSLAEARRRMHHPIQDESLWQHFQEEYSTQNVVQNFPVQSMGIQLQSLLDPRISELMVQLSTLAREEEIDVYLPHLIDDPSRASAWYVSSAIRQIIYDAIATRAATVHASLPLLAITEFSRRGSRIVPSNMSPSSSASPAQRADSDIICALLFRLQKAKAKFPAVSSWFRYRIFAFRESYCWHINNSKNPPSRNCIARTMMGVVGSLVQWEDIHLEAQIQAVLYALRMLKQGHGCITVNETGAAEGIIELGEFLRDLPPLSGLLPSFMEIRVLAEKEEMELPQVVSYIMQFEQAEI